MSTPSELSAESMAHFLNAGGIIDLSNRSKFRLTGNDRVRYLSGQVTQAVSDVSESQALYSCITNHKGKMEGDLFITGSDHLQSFLLDADSSLRELLFTRLDRYIIADDAELTDVTDEWTLVHVLGNHPVDASLSPRTSNRFGIPGLDYWIPAGDNTTALTGNIPCIDHTALEVIRIVHGIGTWGSELSSDILPPEARLEDRAVSYTKGCYIGQEIISRIRSVGRVNRTLERIDWVDGDALAVGMILTNSSGKEVGRITSAVYHPAHDDGARWIALAFIRTGSSEQGTRLSAHFEESPDSPSGQNMLSSTVEVRNTPNHQET